MGKSGKRRLKERFYDWQCTLRQAAMRDDGGRPSAGMCPRVMDLEGAERLPRLTVLLAPKEPEESTAFFRFQVLKSPDPRESYEKSMRYLQSEFYKDPSVFADRLLAVLPEDAPLAAASRCILEFSQGRHSFTLPCTIKVLEETHAKRAAAIWHNRVFNPALPGSAKVLAFKPDWDAAGSSL